MQYVYAINSSFTVTSLLDLPMWVNLILTGIEGLLLYVIIMVLLKGLNKNDGASMPLIGRFFR